MVATRRNAGVAER